MTLKTLTCICSGSIICGVITGMSSFVSNMYFIRPSNLFSELGALFTACYLFLLRLLTGAIIGYVQKAPWKIVLVVGSTSLVLLLVLFAAL